MTLMLLPRTAPAARASQFNEPLHGGKDSQTCFVQWRVLVLTTTVDVNLGGGHQVAHDPVMVLAASVVQRVAPIGIYRTG
jgi:hypothetical protein